MSSNTIYINSSSCLIQGIKFVTLIHNYEPNSLSFDYTMRARCNNTSNILSEHTTQCYLPGVTNSSVYSASCLFINNMRYNIEIHSYDNIDNSFVYEFNITDKDSGKTLSEYTVRCFLPKQEVEQQDTNKGDNNKKEVKQQEMKVNINIDYIIDVSNKTIICNTIKQFLDNIANTNCFESRSKQFIKLFNYILKEGLEFTKTHEKFKNTVIDKCHEFKDKPWYNDDIVKKCDEVLIALGVPLRRSKRIQNMPRVDYRED